ncbi:NAD-dependent epimerase/dehydratase family protein (plasmid) [Streptomyces murinus]|uniref:NAD-dependent epimerase/dehydratase family protein n=1 Tax=Streptomyces murinus TaxID=33900 RepID=UPI000A2459D4|nr:NAD-dependent epimerase/dehydratase family protein [Streptomyces murinus]WDO11341.1 NAD-dependent epimerase/dehydratase family protein [Streptomyces murinus]
MRIAVTGAAGYLGLSVVTALSAAGHEIIALSRTGRPNWPTGVHAYTADLADHEATNHALRGTDALCHLAAVMRTNSPHTVAEYYRTNVVGTLDLLDAIAVEQARTGRPTRMVFLSSAAVYGTGQGRRPLRETDPTVPAGPYGHSKLAAEHAIDSYARAGALGAVTLRLFNAAGIAPSGRAPGNSLISQALNCAASGRTLRINGDGCAIRDFVHITDVVKAVGLALNAAVPGSVQTYNLGAVPASVQDVVDAAQQISGRHIDIDRSPAHGNDITYSVADTTQAVEHLGWVPKHTSLDTMIRDQWQWVLGKRTTEEF